MINNNEKIILDNELEAVAGGADNPAILYHIVVPGDTMSSIARRYGTTPENLQRLNPQIKHATKIYVGDRIRIC